SDSSNGCPDGETCDSSQPAGPVHGLRSDGSVNITVEEAWPNRAAETPPLSALELAQACSLLAACGALQTVGGLAAENVGLCANPGSSFFWEERAVPTGSESERWTFAARAVIAAKGSCNAVRAVSTARPNEIECQEDGCW